MILDCEDRVAVFGRTAGASGTDDDFAALLTAGATAFCLDHRADRKAAFDAVGRAGILAPVILAGPQDLLADALHADIEGLCGVQTDVNSGEDLLAAVADRCAAIWFIDNDTHALSTVADRAQRAGVRPDRVVVEPGLDGIGSLATEGHLVACCPDPPAPDQDGVLEATVVSAVYHGARVLRTTRVHSVRRCADLTEALLAERDAVRGSEDLR